VLIGLAIPALLLWLRKPEWKQEGLVVDTEEGAS
jgi:hypothetical protein